MASAIPPPSSVPKYEMPAETYSSLPDTVLAYKKMHHIGRFDPHAPELKEQKVADMWREVEAGSTWPNLLQCLSSFLVYAKV